ncbi:uncharacterized protein [Anabrus simplex]|uniref:uncharacterized protein n=1 Tax=Anabrus simplex TaxID=316456 RepID=UPI0035A3A478
MDLETKTKEEPAWLEGTANASLVTIEHETQIITLKKEAKSELTEPGPPEECSFKPSEDTNEEVFIEQHTVDQPSLYIKEETKTNLYQIDDCSTVESENLIDDIKWAHLMNICGTDGVLKYDKDIQGSALCSDYCTAMLSVHMFLPS